MELIDLSHTIRPAMDQWPGDDRPVVLERVSEHGPGNHMSTHIAMGCHVGTHVDAPLHFLAGQPAVDEMALDRFWGRALVLRAGNGDAADPLPPRLLEGHDLRGLGFVLFDTGWARHWGTPRYYETWPSLEPGLMGALAAAGLKGVGLDTPSPDVLGASASHDIGAAAGMINIENLANLDRLPTRGSTLLVFPLRFAGTEASPVRAAAIVDGS